MRKVKIVADSSCDLFALKKCDFASAPMKVITADKEFVDVESLDLDSMVNFMDSYKGKSKSSCPNMNDWIEAFGDADDIFCVTITSALSGSYNSACAAKQIYEAENKGKRVFVIDTLSAGPEVTMIVEKLEEYVDAGMSYEEICEAITAYQKNTGLAFMLRSLKTFANNGRVSPLVAKAIGVLGICIVGKASQEGTLAPLHKCRGERRSLETLVDVLGTEGYRSGKISIGHCQNEEGAQLLRQMILEKYSGADVEIHRLNHPLERGCGTCRFLRGVFQPQGMEARGRGH